MITICYYLLMRNLFALAIFFTVFFSYLYWYQSAFALCQLPITYSLGKIDERFNLSESDVKERLAAAEAVWEKPLGLDLFVYDENSKFKINFIFDERQEFATAEFGFQSKLDKVQSVNEEMKRQYEALVVTYESLKRNYEDRSEKYETSLREYNQAVLIYNRSNEPSAGETFVALEKTKSELNTERLALNQLARELNNLVDEINKVGREANLLVETYNRGVGEYNETFGKSREFTQGDYRGSEINIYTYTEENELRLVLAHEFGHALGIGHTEGRQSIMYYMIGEQSKDLTLTEYDIEAFRAVCTEKSVWDTLSGSFSNFIN